MSYVVGKHQRADCFAAQILIDTESRATQDVKIGNSDDAALLICFVIKEKDIATGELVCNLQEITANCSAPELLVDGHPIRTRCDRMQTVF